MEKFLVGLLVTWYIAHLCCDLFLWPKVFDKLASTQEHGTVDSVWGIVTWSFNAMFDGKWPDRDYKGKKLLGFEIIGELFWCGKRSIRIK